MYTFTWISPDNRLHSYTTDDVEEAQLSFDTLNQTDDSRAPFSIMRNYSENELDEARDEKMQNDMDNQEMGEEE